MKNDAEFKKKIINEISEQTKKNIIDFINNSYDKLSKTSYYFRVAKVDLIAWKNNIIDKVNQESKNLISYIEQNKGTEKKKENITSKEIIIETKSELNNFTATDIQEENKEITRNFQNESQNYLENPNEKIENEDVALFFKEVARISRIAYNEGKLLLKIMEEKYIKSKGGKILINNEKERKEFSSWVKNFEKEKGRNEYEKIIGHIKIFEKNENIKEQKYLSKLFNDLTLMYFHCNLSFPLVKISFDKEDNFNTDKMIDFINTGKDRKVNLIILPSLFSNGIFLENGKSWVFTYGKNTFKFEDSLIRSLNKLIDEENSTSHKKENDLVIKVFQEIKNDKKIITIEDTNNKILGNKEYQIIFRIQNKKNNCFYTKIVNEKTFTIPKDHDIKKYEINKIIFSSSNIIEKNI